MSDDEDNTEWTKADFARAKSSKDVPDWIHKAFPKTRGPQKAPTKELISIRLSPDVLAHYRGKGRGWQSQIDADLREVMKGK